MLEISRLLFVLGVYLSLYIINCYAQGHDGTASPLRVSCIIFKLSLGQRPRAYTRDLQTLPDRLLDSNWISQMPSLGYVDLIRWGARRVIVSFADHIEYVYIFHRGQTPWIEFVLQNIRWILEPKSDASDNFGDNVSCRTAFMAETYDRIPSQLIYHWIS